jgi:hypothetical protein
MTSPKAGSHDDWRQVLFEMMDARERDEVKNPHARELLFRLEQQLIEALADPNHPINANYKEVG